jgi:23S rRNA pseudouridine2605 synthase
MRINRFVALGTGMSRRTADTVISEGRVLINGTVAQPSSQVKETDEVTFDGQVIAAPEKLQTVMLNKPTGCVVSRDGQGSHTIYDLLPAELQNLKPIGRLDKDSSGLLLLTNDGELAHELTHPSFQKVKQYEVTLKQPLQPLHRQMIAEMGITLEDGPSKLGLERIEEGDDTWWLVTMREGRNRQIRRTFSALGYDIKRLHRTVFGNYSLGDLKPGKYQAIEKA